METHVRCLKIASDEGTDRTMSEWNRMYARCTAKMPYYFTRVRKGKNVDSVVVRSLFIFDAMPEAYQQKKLVERDKIYGIESAVR